MNTASNASAASISAALTTILIILDERVGWNFGPEFWGAFLVVLFALPPFGLLVIRYVKRAKREINDEIEQDQKP